LQRGGAGLGRHYESFEELRGREREKRKERAKRKMEESERLAHL
jgi:hypothetical protein